MRRREFLKRTIKYGVAAVAAFVLKDFNILFAQNKKDEDRFDLVAVKNGEPAAMFDEAIMALGGMAAFIKKGQKVLVKPNIGWAVPPERAANTNPNLVGHIVKRCIEAGAEKVYVFDNSVDYSGLCYTRSGIEEAVKSSGGTMVPSDSTGYYQKTPIPGGKVLKEAMVHETFLEAEVFINVPVLKHHSTTELTIGMKNNMGIVWDRRFWHMQGINECIADFAAYRKPDLTVVDAYAVVTKNGPRGVSMADVKILKTLLASTDPVAVDAAAAKIMGYEPEKIDYIKIAGDEKKLGKYDLTQLRIKRISL